MCKLTSLKPLINTPVMIALLFILTGQPSEVSAAEKQSTPKPTPEVAAKIDRAKAAIGSFKTALQSALKTAIKEQGLEGAISVCNVKAPAIAAQLSQQKDLKISRTALRLRNPANKADDWEEEMMAQFKARHKKGEPLTPMAAYKMEEGEFRFLKAIPTSGICLKCHGSSVKPALLKKIKSLYPMDEATGFLAGDLRGAFSVTISLDDSETN